MAKSELSASRIQAWLACLPEDVRDRIADPADPALDQKAELLEREIEIAIKGDESDVVRVLDAHEQTVIDIGRSRRMRLLAMLFDTPWPMPIAIAKRIVSEREDEDGEGASGKTGTAKSYPPLFRSDLESYAKAITARIVRAASSSGTVEAISSGIRSSDVTSGAAQPGGMS